MLSAVHYKVDFSWSFAADDDAKPTTSAEYGGTRRLLDAMTHSPDMTEASADVASMYAATADNSLHSSSHSVLTAQHETAQKITDELPTSKAVSQWTHDFDDSQRSSETELAVATSTQLQMPPGYWTHGFDVSEFSIMTDYT